MIRITDKDEHVFLSLGKYNLQPFGLYENTDLRKLAFDFVHRNKRYRFTVNRQLGNYNISLRDKEVDKAVPFSYKIKYLNI